jgi:hypothetical protein
MKWKLVVFLAVIGCCVAAAAAQGAQQSGDAKSIESSKDPDAKAYSGMYTFLREGEFVQITVEDGGSVTGFVSRFGDGESDKGAFLDQFFKTGKLAGKTLTFTTDVVHGLSYDFKGEVDRGEGKSAGDDAYFVLKGALTENMTDVNKKVSSHSRDVVLKMFPQDATPGPAARK